MVVCGWVVYGEEIFLIVINNADCPGNIGLVINNGDFCAVCFPDGCNRFIRDPVMKGVEMDDIVVIKMAPFPAEELFLQPVHAFCFPGWLPDKGGLVSFVRDSVHPAVYAAVILLNKPVNHALHAFQRIYFVQDQVRESVHDRGKPETLYASFRCTIG